ASVYVSSLCSTSSAPTQLYTLSLHDALPISVRIQVREWLNGVQQGPTSFSSPIRLGLLWQQVTMDVTALKAGSSLDIQVLDQPRSEEHTSELQSRGHLVCRLLLEKKKR